MKQKTNKHGVGLALEALRLAPRFLSIFWLPVVGLGALNRGLEAAATLNESTGGTTPSSDSLLVSLAKFGLVLVVVAGSLWALMYFLLVMVAWGKIVLASHARGARPTLKDVRTGMKGHRKGLMGLAVRVWTHLLRKSGRHAAYGAAGSVAGFLAYLAVGRWTHLDPKFAGTAVGGVWIAVVVLGWTKASFCCWLDGSVAPIFLLTDGLGAGAALREAQAWAAGRRKKLLLAQLVLTIAAMLPLILLVSMVAAGSLIASKMGLHLDAALLMNPWAFVCLIVLGVCLFACEVVTMTAFALLPSVATASWQEAGGLCKPTPS